VGGTVTWSRRDFWEPMFVLAVRKLHHLYAQAPLPARRPWTELSQSQQNAEDAA